MDADVSASSERSYQDHKDVTGFALPDQRESHPMNRKEEFEALLAYFANAPISFAGGRADGGVSDEAILKELRSARARLKRNPELFSGDPEGFFTFDDPVLAITAYAFQGHRVRPSVLGLAGNDGGDLRNESIWQWVKTGIHMWRSRKDEAYQTLMGMTPRHPIKFDKDVLRIAVAGDAGFRGKAQTKLIESIRERHCEDPFDLLIHLGDTYFAGKDTEFLHHLLGPFKSVGPRFLTLIGNHDLYLGGDGFLSVLTILEQPGRYFCVESPHWRIACLDTSLYAETLRRNFGRLDKGQKDWLDEQLDADDGKKLILMSHHYAVSGWEKPSHVLSQQMNPRLKKVFAWYWGHEHGCATYGRRTSGINGACVGNGAFLEKRKAQSREPAPTWVAAGHCSCYRDKTDFWPHGYLELELQPAQVVERYHLETGKSHRRTLKRY